MHHSSRIFIPPPHMIAFKQTSPKRTESRFGFAQDDGDSQIDVIATPQQHTVRKGGVVVRIVGDPLPKYGFIESSDGRIFFHYTSLPVELVACIEKGTPVEFDVAPNPFANHKPMAVNIQIKEGKENNCRTSGVLTKWIPEKRFGFIETHDGTTYFAHETCFTAADTDTFTDADMQTKQVKVLFEKSMNLKTSPPKPFAKNIRVISIEETPLLRKASPGAWVPTPRTLQARGCAPSSEDVQEASSISPRNSSIVNFARSHSWRGSTSQTPRSTLFQKYDPEFKFVSPPPGFAPRDCCEHNTSLGWRSARRARGSLSCC